MNKSFKQQFQPYACEGDTITVELPGGFTATATLFQDDDDRNSPDERQDGYWPSIKPDDPGYIGPKSKATLRRHMKRASEFYRAWEGGAFCYCGVAVVVSKDDVQLTSQYAHALWGVDVNWPGPITKRNHYLRDVANELLPEALAEAKATLAKLKA